MTLDFNHPDWHMGHLFFNFMKQNPDPICQIDAATGEQETNASVLSRSVRLARCFRRMGLLPGHVLALGGRNHLDLHIPYYAAIMNGLPITGVDPSFKFGEIKSLFKIVQPKIAFCQIEHYADYVEAAKELEIDTIVFTFDEGENSFAKLLETYNDNGPIEDFEPAIIDFDKVYAWLISTGGTTGVLKVAAFKHKAWINKMSLLFNLFKNRKPKRAKGDNIGLNLSPVQWVSGFFNAIAMPIMRQVKLQTSAPATTEHVIDLINKYKPSTGLLGPSLITSILKNEKECDFSCFESIFLTGGKIHKDIIIEVRNKVGKGTEVTEAYGQTENLGPIFLPNPSGPIGNCGREIPGFEVKLVNPETKNKISEPNVTGELWSNGAGFTEYYNDPEETAKAFTEDGWYKTGDLLYRDVEGNYYFVERLKMLIKYRNYHIIPPELEAVIRTLDGVLDVSVTSVPHDEDGERPVACVVRSPGLQVTAQEIKDLVASKLSDSKQLRGGVVFMDKLPLTSSGKVARGKLQKIVLHANRE